MVPYISPAYCDHVFRDMDIQGNQIAVAEGGGRQEDKVVENESHVSLLIEAARKIRDLVKAMSDTADDLSGYIIYKAESEEDREAKLKEEKRIKELIKQN